MRTRPAGMRSSGSPGSWPPSAAEFRCVSLTLHSHPKTSNLFPEFDSMFMVANWTVLTSHAQARVRIGTPSARAEASPATSRPARNRSGSAEVSVEGSPRESRRAAGGRARSAEMKRHCGRPFRHGRAGGALAGAHLGGRGRGAGGHYQEGASRWERALVRKTPRSTATGASPVPAPAGGHRSPQRICPRRARPTPADFWPDGSASLSLRAAAHRGRATGHHRR